MVYLYGLLSYFELALSHALFLNQINIEEGSSRCQSMLDLSFYLNVQFNRAIPEDRSSWMSRISALLLKISYGNLCLENAPNISWLTNE